MSTTDNDKDAEAAKNVEALSVDLLEKNYQEYEGEVFEDGS